jgi:hypothetical protein
VVGDDRWLEPHLLCSSIFSKLVAFSGDQQAHGKQ